MPAGCGDLVIPRPQAAARLPSSSVRPKPNQALGLGSDKRIIGDMLEQQEMMAMQRHRSPSHRVARVTSSF